MTFQFNSRIALYEPNGAFIKYLPTHSGYNFSQPVNDISAMNLKYAKIAKDAGRLQQPFEAGVEIAKRDGTWFEPPQSRYIYQAWSDDISKGDADVLDLKMPGYATILDQPKVLHQGMTDLLIPSKYDEDGNYRMIAWTPGRILQAVWNESRHFDAAIGGAVSWSFTNTHDSAGVPWNKQLTISYEPGTSLLTMLQGFAEAGIVDWQMQGRQLQMYNAETIRNLDRLQFRLDHGRASGNLESPASGTIEGLKHIVVLRGDEGKTWVERNTATPSPWGKNIAFINQAGVSDEGSARVLVQGELFAGSKERVQYTRKHDLVDMKHLPFLDYNAGARIYARNRLREFEEMQVMQISIDVTETGRHSATFTLNDKFLSLTLRQSRKMKGLQGGASGQAGNGTVPSKPDKPAVVDPNDPMFRKPKPPIGLLVNSSSYIQVPEGYPAAQITAAFTIVSEGVDGKPQNITSVHLYGRKNGTTSWRYLGTSGTSPISFSPLPVGEQWQFQVEAQAENDIRSARSATTTITLAVDTTAPGKPAKPTLTSDYGIISVKWNGKLATGAAQPTDYVYSTVFVDGRGAQGRIYPTGSTGGTFQITDLTAGETYGVYVTSTDSSGNESVASDISTIQVKSVLDGTSIPQLEADLATAKTDIVNLDGAVQAATAAAGEANTKATTAAGNALTALEDAATANTAAATANTAATKAQSYADSLVAQAENKVANPGFEFQFDGWSQEGVAAGSHWIDNAAANAYAGSRSGMMSMNSGVRGLVTAPWPVNGGERYRFSAWFRTTNGTGSTNGGFRPQYSTDNGNTWAAGTSGNIDYTTVFKQETFDYIVPANANMLRLRLAWPQVSGLNIRIDEVAAKDVTVAQAAIDNAATAQTAANTAQAKANKAETDAANAKIAADNAAQAASTAQGKADTAEGKAASAQASADNAIRDAALATKNAEAIMASVENRIVDPSFDRGIFPPNSTSEVWRVDNTSGAGRTDNFALRKHSHSTPFSIPILRNFQGAEQAVPVKAGQVWELSAWVRTTSDWNGTAGNSKLRLANQASQPVALNLTPASANTGWRYLSGRYTIPASGVDALRLTLVGDNTAGTVWWDDMSLKDITQAVEALSAAAAAQSKADAAQLTANAAQTAAGTAQETADTAITSASSRNALYHATTEPSGVGTRTGDMWHQWTTLSTGGQLLKTWRWSGSAWLDMPLSETYLPLVNIGSGTYGALKGNRLEAQSITTRELLVGNPSNLITDPNTTNLIVAGTGPGKGDDSPFWKHWAVMTGSAAGWSTQATTGLPGNTIRHNVTSGAGDQRLGIRESIQVANGEWYYIGFKADIQGWAGAPPQVRLVWRTVTGGYITQSDQLAVTAGWSEQNLKIRVPTNNANIMKAQFEIIVPAGATAGTLYIGNLVWRPANTGSMIVDGSITAAQLNAENVAAGLGSFMKVEAKNIVAGTGNFDSAVVGKLKTAVLTANAVDAGVLKGDAIDGKVITGATYRTAASGARVEINGSALVGAVDKGLTVYNSSNQATLRLGYNIPTGLEVRHPSVDRLIPISDAVFGTTTLSGGSSYGYYQNIGGSPGAVFVTTGSNRNNQTATDIPGTFTALTNKTQVQLFLEVVWGPAAPRGIAIMVHIASGGSLQGTPIFMYVAAKEFGVDFQTPVAVGSVTTTPGQTYRLHMNTTVKTVNQSLGDSHPYGTQIFRVTGIVTPL